MESQRLHILLPDYSSPVTVPISNKPSSHQSTMSNLPSNSVTRPEKPMMGEPGCLSWTDSDSYRDDDDEELPSAEHETAMGSIGEFHHDEDLFHRQGLSYIPTATVAPNQASPLITPNPPATPDPATTQPTLLTGETALELPHRETDREPMYQAETALTAQSEAQPYLQHLKQPAAQQPQARETEASSSSFPPPRRPPLSPLTDVHGLQSTLSPLTDFQLRVVSHLNRPEADRMALAFRDNNSGDFFQAVLKYSKASAHRAEQSPPPESEATSPVPDSPTEAELRDLSAQDFLGAMPTTKEENMTRILQSLARK
jgi:hypothetical protein